MIGSCHISLALLSLVLAFALSYQLMDVSFRLAASRLNMHRALWLMTGTPTLALGLWSLQFVAMLAWRQQPIDSFHPVWSLGAFILAILICYGGLRLSAMRSSSLPALLLGSLGLGSAAVLMQLMGLASIEFYPATDGPGWALAPLTLVCAVVPMAVIARTIQRFRHVRRTRWFAHRLLVASGMALLVSVPLHVALGAAVFRLHLVGDSDAMQSLVWLGTTVGLFGLSVILTTIFVSRHCVHLRKRAQTLSGSIDRLHGELNHLATHDPLTGLPNRSTLIGRLEDMLATARENSGRVAVICIDLDGFKTINETLGHGVGDDMLRMVARRLQRPLAAGNLARVGGDEFVAVVDGVRDIASAMRLAESLNEVMQPLFLANGITLHVTPSMGVALYPEDADTVEELLANADVAMYEAKAGGRNCCRLYNASMKRRALRGLQIQQGLQTAMEDGALSLHFQPKHDALTGVVVGAEALVRWSHPELGFISPAEFIPVAERSGHIAQIGEWVIREACRQLCAWRADGLPMVPVAINLSPLQLDQDDLPEIASKIIADAGLSPAQIMFEVTESMAMHDAVRTMVVLGDFRARGFEFAIDDFGTGYSSLAYLQKFQVRQLKIDRFFVNALDNGGHEARAIITAIIALAHTLDMEVVAEGVETQEQMDQLRQLGCDQIQGYFLSRPMPPAVFELTCLVLDEA